MDRRGNPDSPVSQAASETRKIKTVSIGGIFLSAGENGFISSLFFSRRHYLSRGQKNATDNKSKRKSLKMKRYEDEPRSDLITVLIFIALAYVVLFVR